MFHFLISHLQVHIWRQAILNYFREGVIGAEEPVESTLLEQMTAHLNGTTKLASFLVRYPKQGWRILTNTCTAEVVLGTVKDQNDAIDWIRATYLYIRMQKNPQVWLNLLVLLLTICMEELDRLRTFFIEVSITW